MSNKELHYRGLLEIGEQIRRGEVSPIAVTEHLLDRIGTLEPGPHS